MTPTDCFELGYVQRPHGLQGELMLALDTDEPEAYQDLDKLYLTEKGSLVPYKIESFYLQKQGAQALVMLKGINSIEAAEALKGATVYLPLSYLPALKEDQFYYHEIVGYTLIDEAQGGTTVGTIAEVYEMPQQLMLGVQVQGREVLVPMADAFWVRIDKKARTLHLNLPEGLVDVFLSEQ